MTTPLEQWLDYIQQCHPLRMELGLERMRAVAGRLGLDRPPAPLVTVAGTNGKGSTVALLESLAAAEGLSTAVFTSPHLFHFGERVRINRCPAGDDELCRAFEHIEQARGEDALTYYEFATLAALWLAQRAEPDLMILEVGLGGRLDAVNILDPTVAVITSVGLDHTDWLGEDRETIAVEKAGILRAGTPVVYGEPDMPATVGEIAERLEAPLHRAGRDFGAGGGRLWFSGGEVVLETGVELGEDNLATAVQALTLAGTPPGQAASDAAAGRTLPGRCEYRRIDGVDWYLDVGHNREALTRFARRVGPPACGGRTLALCAMLSGKPVAALEAFVPMVAHWHLAGLDGPRGTGPERLADALAGRGPVSCHDTVARAVRAVRGEAVAGDRVLVFGSFHTVVEAVNTLEDR